MRKGQQLLRQLPVSWCIGFQQMVFQQLIGVGCVIGEAVYDVADVIEDVSGHLVQNIIPLLLRRYNVRPPKDGIRLLEPPLWLLVVKRKQLNRNMQTGCKHSGEASGGGHRSANMRSIKL